MMFFPKPKLAYRFEHDASRNPTICTFHVSERMLNGPEEVLSFRNPWSQVDKQTQMVKEILAIKGIQEITIRGYEIYVTRGRVYTWNELIFQVESAIRQHLERVTAAETA